jgi:predicted nucleic acid-binding protein
MSANPTFQFIDTNILIYAYDLSQGVKHDKALALIESLWEAGNGCLSTQVLQEFYVNITRKSAKPRSPDQAAQIIRDFSNWHIHRPGAEDILAAIELHQRYNISFWDAMILRSAMQSNCQTVWSEDLSHGQEYDATKVINPFE